MAKALIALALCKMTISLSAALGLACFHLRRDPALNLQISQDVSDVLLIKAGEIGHRAGLSDRFV